MRMKLGVICVGCAMVSIAQENLLKEIVDKTLSASAFSGEFTFETKLPNGDEFKYDGTFMFQAGDLFLEYSGTGGKEVHAKRYKNNRVAVWHDVLEEWVDARQVGQDDTAKGIQSPKDLLERLKAMLSSLKNIKNNNKQVSFSVAGLHIYEIVKEFVEKDGVKWTDSEVDSSIAFVESKFATEIIVGGRLVSNQDQFRGKEISIKACLKLRDYDKEGKFSYRKFDKGRTPIPAAPNDPP